MLCLGPSRQAARVRADRSLVPSMFEEVMRYFTPATTSYRATETDVEVGGVKVPKDRMVSIQLGAANRDPRQFPDADAFDVGRAEPARSVTGAGPTVGAAMARVETRVVFNLLLDRFPTLRVDRGRPPLRLPGRHPAQPRRGLDDAAGPERRQRRGRPERPRPARRHHRRRADAQDPDLDDVFLALTGQTPDTSKPAPAGTVGADTENGALV
ncbi:hypothetical protein SVIOM342S_00492 [Streptomyces violaceorubidus]